MLSFIRSGRARKAMAAALAATFVLSVAGCGQKQQQGGKSPAQSKVNKKAGITNQGSNAGGKPTE